MDINFELYKIFYHTAKSGSFSAAAQKLYISQSAVSQAIRNLEEKIGSQLFLRNPRSIKLTDAGGLLFKHIEQAYNFIKAGESKIYEMQNMSFGEIRIGVSDTVCKYHVIPHIESFNRLYPKIKIRVINRTSSQIISILKNGLVDFGVVTLPVDDNNITVHEFTGVEDIFIASDRFSSLKNKSINFKELSEYPLLMLDKNSSTRCNLDLYLRQKGIELAPEIELESIDLLVEFAKIGLGVACVLRESALSAIEKNEVFEVRTSEALPFRRLGIISMKDVPLSQASYRFIELLREP